MMVLLVACTGAAGVLFWLQGGDLGQVMDKLKRAMGRAEDEMGEIMDEMSSVPAYASDP